MKGEDKQGIHIINRGEIVHPKLIRGNQSFKPGFGQRVCTVWGQGEHEESF